jgi:hypothetical protein
VEEEGDEEDAVVETGAQETALGQVDPSIRPTRPRSRGTLTE